MSKNFRMDGASGEAVARLRSSVSSKNTNIVDIYNVQYVSMMYNVQCIMLVGFKGTFLKYFSFLGR